MPSHADWLALKARQEAEKRKAPPAPSPAAVEAVRLAESVTEHPGWQAFVAKVTAMRLEEQDRLDGYLKLMTEHPLAGDALAMAHGRACVSRALVNCLSSVVKLVPEAIKAGEQA